MRNRDYAYKAAHAYTHLETLTVNDGDKDALHLIKRESSLLEMGRPSMTFAE
jgi:hypothetical protein